MASSSKDASRTFPPIDALPPRYEPAADPRTIVVPGLDTNASVQDQIEQIEQLITIKLQNIDANFARVHQILSTKILPAVRRFAINTEPVRESARFWVSFFEQTAQVRIPTADDFSAATEGPSEQEHEDHTFSAQDQHDETQTEDEANETSVVNQSHSVFDASTSFMPITSSTGGVGAVSSTPMAHSYAKSRSQTHLDVGLTPSDAPSQWDESAISASMESPLDRLDRGLRSLREGDADMSHVPSQPSRPAASSAGSSSLLQNVLSRNLPSAQRARTSPLKVNKKIATPKNLRKDWDGIVDLRSPRPLEVATTHGNWSDSDDDEDGLGLPPGMSPPVTVDFARPAWKATRPAKPSKYTGTDIGSGAASGFKVAQSPVKDAAKRIGRDLVGAVERGGPMRAFAAAPTGLPGPRFGYKPPASSNYAPAPKVGYYGLGSRRPAAADESTNSSISAPSLSGYSRKLTNVESSVEMEPPSLVVPISARGSTQPSANDSGSGIDASLEALMQQVGLSGEEGRNRVPMDDSFNSEDSFDADTMMNNPIFSNLAQPHDNGGDSDSSSEGDEGGMQGAPGAGFLMASGGMEDDSFDDDMDEREMFPAFQVQGEEDEDDPTIFGARTVAARSSTAGFPAALSMQDPLPGAQLRLHGHRMSDDDHDDTETIEMRIGGMKTGLNRHRIPETPTPWNQSSK